LSFCIRLEPAAIVSTPPDVMFSEVLLIFFVLGLWLSAIGFCLNQYKSLRRLETQVHYCTNRKDPLNIGDIKIVAREQDSIIYKKKRYSTVADTHVNPDDLKRLHYVQQYLPKSLSNGTSDVTGLAFNYDDCLDETPLSTTSTQIMSHALPTASHMPLSTHDELAEDQLTAITTAASSSISSISFETNPNRFDRHLSVRHHRTGKNHQPATRSTTHRRINNIEFLVDVDRTRSRSSL
jgi:hypothetical protein